MLSFSQDFDLSQYPLCTSKLPVEYLLDVSCEYPDAEWIHTVIGGHVGRDQDGFAYIWNGSFMKMIIPELDGD